MPKEKKWATKDAEWAFGYVKSSLDGLYTNILACGSLRRGCREVSDLDIVVAVNPERREILLSKINSLAEEVLASGQRTVRIRIKTGMQVDFMIVNPKDFGSAILHLTGSMWFNIKCRKLAKTLGFKLNEYGLWKGDIKVASTELGILESIRMQKFLDPKTRSL